MTHASIRLAIVVSHPIQYYAPWFKHLAQQSSLEVRVFYLWDFGVTSQVDRGFGQALCWDIPLLEGYASEFVPNCSADPGTHHFRGLDNPTLVPRLAAWKPDVILLFGYTYLSHFRIAFSPQLRRIPLLLRGDSHDLARPHGLRTALARWGRSLLFMRFAGSLAVGKANADYFRKAGVPERKIYFVPHCVDNTRFKQAAPQAALEAAAWRRELEIHDEALVVLFAGKFEPQKRPQDLLAAFTRARATLAGSGGPGPVLLFVGSGELEPELRIQAGSQLGRDVFFAPFQNQSQMPRVYATGDLLVLPSMNETWGLAVNEAMNLRRPVIVSSHVGCGPDLVHPGETGWVFDAGDVSGLTGVLADVLTVGRENLARMGGLAQLRVEAYSYQHATAGLLTALAAIARVKS